MIQKSIIDKLNSMYQGDDITAILPPNLKKCRQSSLINQLPKKNRNKYKISKCLLKAHKL